MYLSLKTFIDSFVSCSSALECFAYICLEHHNVSEFCRKVTDPSINISEKGILSQNHSSEIKSMVLWLSVHQGKNLIMVTIGYMASNGMTDYTNLLCY